MASVNTHDSEMYNLWLKADSVPAEGETDAERIARLESQVAYLLRVIGPGIEHQGHVWHPRVHHQGPPTRE
jgi:hypothetical protein